MITLPQSFLTPSITSNPASVSHTQRILTAIFHAAIAYKPLLSSDHSFIQPIK